MKRVIQKVISLAAVLALSACTATIEKPSQTQSGTVSDTAVSKAENDMGKTAENDASAQETPSQDSLASEAVESSEALQTVDNSGGEHTLDFSSVKALVDSMTLEEKTGQILLCRYPDSGAAAAMEKYSLGGYTLYARDFESETPETMLEKTNRIKAAAKIPPFLATDEEGGTVVRMSKFPQYRLTPFSSQIALAREGEEAIKSENEEKAKLLASVGINFNLAPVADITENHLDYIYERTFGKDAETTGEYIALVVETMNENNMGSCLKHFPGYGPNVDTHTGIAEDDRSVDSFEKTDLVPFRYGIEAGAPAVMVNHNIVKAYDGELPASLSPAVHELLRNDMGFEGVIVTDDLGMDAITIYTDGESPYVLAVNAGNDLLCTSDIETAYNDILAAVQSGKIDEARLDESVERILEMKQRLGIIEIG